MMVQDPFYIDFSTQPDNEIWYTTFDNSPIKNINNFTETIFFVGNWGRQPDLQLVRHSYENGIGKIVYNSSIIKLGEQALRTDSAISLISFPKQFKQIHAYCLNYGYYKACPIGIFNIANNTITLAVNSVIFFITYVKQNISFNGSYKPQVIITR